MGDFWNKFKEVATKAGQAAKADPRLAKVAQQAKETVSAFKEGYHQQMDGVDNKPECPQCRKPRPKDANFCPHCGTKLT